MRRSLHRVLDGGRWSLLTIVLLLSSLTGCSTYSDSARLIRQRATGGDLPGALELLEKKGGDDPDVLNLMERGLLLFYEGRHQESNEAFQLADQKIEDLYTKSLSKEALAFLTNDGTLPYSGYPHEQVLLHLYGALNYLALGDEASALVECRKVSERLTRMEDLREDKKGYSDDAFAQWLAGMLYADAGDGNSALVSARRAAEAYAEYETLWGHGPSPAFYADYIEWARRFGFAQEAQEIAEAHPTAAARAEVEPGFEEGELLLVYESGFVDHLEETRLSYPILKNEKDDEDRARRIYRRGHRGALVIDEDVEIDYWLEVALPVLTPTPSELGRARLRVDGKMAETRMVEDVSAIARLTFEEGSGKRILRTIVRALAKYGAVNAVKKKDEGAPRWLANIFVGLTERADTRSWTLLPDRIHLARLRLPAGSYPVQVEVLDSAGRVARTADFEAVRIVPDRLTVIHHRSFR